MSSTERSTPTSNRPRVRVLHLPPPHHGFLSQIHVHAQARGRGVGRHLTETYAREALSRRVAFVGGSSSLENRPRHRAVAALERFGSTSESATRLGRTLPSCFPPIGSSPPLAAPRLLSHSGGDGHARAQALLRVSPDPLRRVAADGAGTAWSRLEPDARDLRSPLAPLRAIALARQSTPNLGHRVRTGWLVSRILSPAGGRPSISGCHCDSLQVYPRTQTGSPHMCARPDLRDRSGAPAESQ